MGDFQTVTTVGRTRTAAGCQWCPDQIPVGQAAVRISGKMEGSLFRVAFHPDCWEAVGRDPCTIEDPDYGCPYKHDRGKTCDEMPSEPPMRY